MSDKPDLSGYAPELREALIARRNFWRTKRGRPAEMWHAATGQLVDRDAHIVREAVAGAVAALTAQSATGTAITEVAPNETATVTDSAPSAVPPVPEPLARPFHELPPDEFRTAAASQFADLFNRPRPPSPFWRDLVGPQTEGGTQ